MSKDFKAELTQVQEHLKNDFDWKDTSINFVHERWIIADLQTMTPKEAAQSHHIRCQKLFESVKSEFQSKHSAMTPSAAKSYSDQYH